MNNQEMIDYGVTTRCVQKYWFWSSLVTKAEAFYVKIPSSNFLRISSTGRGEYLRLWWHRNYITCLSSIDINIFTHCWFENLSLGSSRICSYYQDFAFSSPISTNWRNPGRVKLLIMFVRAYSYKNMLTRGRMLTPSPSVSATPV